MQKEHRLLPKTLGGRTRQKKGVLGASQAQPGASFRSSGCRRSGGEEPRARPRLPGRAPASAPRIAQRQSPVPRRPPALQLAGPAASASAPRTVPRAPSRRGQPTCFPSQHRGQPPFTGLAAGSEWSAPLEHGH
ncbi:uncharacterized protein LOC115276266 [Suricata suricatta]|uniref:uncharacterized protein LOC115276266 n=1 Tax=Suricata suricatta TaxID=37032 RepID=UPI001155CAEA|nr:uncharacterized protein LOC115276266 [Suricata suricatta]